jgi:tripartite-type tricarboxylate transporter receptor subunit TctC
VPGYDASGWWGIGAPRNTPAVVIEKLNTAIDASLADPGLKQRIAELGDTVFLSSPSEFKKFIADYTEKWGKVIRAANIRAE